MLISSRFEMRETDLTLIGILDKCCDIYQRGNYTLMTELL